MAELTFKGKEFVYNHHLSVAIRPLKMLADKGVGPASLAGNLVIQGDNLHALKALLPLYAGKVDLVYIDPPYNTGKSGWSYDDRVNSPMIREWLASTPITVDDQLRHDKWACMMWPRLRLLKELMRPGGVIFASIDDHEVSALKHMMMEIWGESAFVGTIIWKNATDNNPTNIAVEHEYIHAFALERDKLAKEWKSPSADLRAAMLKAADEILAASEDPGERSARYKAWHSAHKEQLGPLKEYNQLDEGGVFTASRSVHNPGKEGYRWELMNPRTGEHVPQPLMGYRFGEETRDRLLGEGRIIFSDKSEQLIRLKSYLRDYREKMPSVIEIDGRRGANELKKLFPERKQAFKNPKTFSLVQWLISFAGSKDALVLDSFGGSGTTAHAVLAANQRDGGKRRFILIECEDYADVLTAERVRRVIGGVPDAKDEAYRLGTGGAFSYCVLDEALELDRLLSGEVLPSFAELGAQLAHTATHQAVDLESVDEARFFVGETDSHCIWMLYRPQLEWLKSSEAALSLERAKYFVETAPGKRHLVFAPARHVSQKVLDELGLPLEFAPLPLSLFALGRG